MSRKPPKLVRPPKPTGNPSTMPKPDSNGPQPHDMKWLRLKRPGWEK